MTSEELLGKLKEIQKMKYESQILELKSAEKGCPSRLYDTLSSFSNQDNGGIIIFGVDEKQVYSYEAYRKKYQDDIRIVPRATLADLDQNALAKYMILLKEGKPNLAKLSDEKIYELMSITSAGAATLSSVLLFSPYPQAYFPQLCITAIVVPGNEIGEVDKDGARFLDNVRIEGPIPLMLENALQFVKRNMRHKTIVNPETGKREDKTDYPLTAIREAILNALVHRDYSMHTEGMPIQLIMYEDRLELRNPGGIYGRMSIDQLGKVQADTRNPVLASALEVLGITENRYSGIPTIRREMQAYNLLPAEFLDERGSFIVKFYKKAVIEHAVAKRLIEFCGSPRNRQEICEFLGVKTAAYAIKQYVQPLIEQGSIKLLFPEAPRSPKQKYYSEL